MRRLDPPDERTSATCLRCFGSGRFCHLDPRILSALTVDPSHGRPLSVRAPRPDEAAPSRSSSTRSTAGWFGVAADHRGRNCGALGGAVGGQRAGFPVAVSRRKRLSVRRRYRHQRDMRLDGAPDSYDDEAVVARSLEDVEPRTRLARRRAKRSHGSFLRTSRRWTKARRCKRAATARFAAVREALRCRNLTLGGSVSRLAGRIGCARSSPSVTPRGPPAVDGALADTGVEPESYETGRRLAELAGVRCGALDSCRARGGIVGVAQCRYEPPGSNLGWFELLAVDRSWRRRDWGSITSACPARVPVARHRDGRPRCRLREPDGCVPCGGGCRRAGGSTVSRLRATAPPGTPDATVARQARLGREDQAQYDRFIDDDLRAERLRAGMLSSRYRRARSRTRAFGTAYEACPAEPALSGRRDEPIICAWSSRTSRACRSHLASGVPGGAVARRSEP